MALTLRCLALPELIWSPHSGLLVLRRPKINSPVPWYKTSSTLEMSLRMAELGSVCVASGPMWVNSKHPNRATQYPLYTSLCTGELNATRKHKCFLCSPFYVKGVSLGHV